MLYARVIVVKRKAIQRTAAMDQ